MIDAHLHVVPPNLPGAGSLGPILNESPNTVAQAVREQLRAAGMTAAFAMPELGAPPDDPLGIQRTLTIAAQVPGLRPIGLADPTKGIDPDHFKRVDQELKRGRVVALKAYLGYLHFEPAHANYRRYYELAANYRIPVIFHTGDNYSPRAKLKYSQPLGVDEVAVDHPDTNFVIAHLGNPWTLDAAEVVYKNLNVWADLSGLLVGDESLFADPSGKDYLSDLTARVKSAWRYCERPNRILFGSDWPLIPIAAYRQFIASLVPVDHHHSVFFENAQMLFRPK